MKQTMKSLKECIDKAVSSGISLSEIMILTREPKECDVIKASMKSIFSYDVQVFTLPSLSDKIIQWYSENGKKKIYDQYAKLDYFRKYLLRRIYDTRFYNNLTENGVFRKEYTLDWNACYRDVYALLPKNKRGYRKILNTDWTDVVKEWVVLESKLFNREKLRFRTLDNDTVKSKSEIRIGNYLTICSIDYEYEKKCSIDSNDTLRNTRRAYVPDFTISDCDGQEYYIEFFGMDNEKYKDGAKWKNDFLGKRLISIYPDTIMNLRGNLSDELMKRGIYAECNNIPVDEIKTKIYNYRIGYAIDILATSLVYKKYEDSNFFRKSFYNKMQKQWKDYVKNDIELCMLIKVATKIIGSIETLERKYKLIILCDDIYSDNNIDKKIFIDTIAKKSRAKVVII